MSALPDTQALWLHVYGERQGYLAAFTGLRVSPAAKLSNIVERFFAYPDQADKAARWLTLQSRGGRETYVCAHLLTTDSRTKAAAAPLLALYVDGDGAPPPEQFPPTAIVTSSEGREQFYWRLSRAVEPSVGEDLNRRLAYMMNADKSGWDLTQLLRPPGTANHKYPDGPVVRLVEIRDGAFDPDELARLLPEVPRPAPIAAQVHPEPPIALYRHHRDVWDGLCPVLRPDGRQIDRSASLVKVAGVLAQQGLAQHVIVDALAERDAALGWNKYSGRDDALARYEQIAEVVTRELPKYTERERQTETAPSRFRLHTRAEFLNTPDPTWLVDGLVPQPGAGLLYSPSGLGKSFVALDLACSVATGLRWLGHATTRGDAIYVAAEGQAGFKKRLQAWEDAHGVEANRLFWITDAPQFMAAEDVKAVLAEMMLAGVAPALIVIDTLSRTLVGGDENSAKDVGLYLSSMETLKAATGAAIWVIHHTGHNAQDRPRGSSTIMPAVDTLVALSGDKETRQLTLTCEKQKDAAEFAPIHVRLVLHEDSLVVELNDSRDPKTGLSAPAQEALAALREVGADTATTGVWRKLVPTMPERTFYRAKAELLAVFLVENVGSQSRPKWNAATLPNAANTADGNPDINTAILPRPVGVAVMAVDPPAACPQSPNVAAEHLHEGTCRCGACPSARKHFGIDCSGMLYRVDAGGEHCGRCHVSGAPVASGG